MFFNFIWVSTSRSWVHVFICLSQGNSRCNFFMWKPESSAVDIGAQIATMVAQLHALEDSISVMNTSVQALGVVVRSMDMQHSVEKWMKVASVCGVVCFVMLCMLMYKLA